MKTRKKNTSKIQDIKEFTVEYGIKNINILHYLLNEPQPDILTSFDLKLFKYTYDIFVSIDKESKVINVIIPFSYLYELKGKRISLLELAIKFDFNIVNFIDFIEEIEKSNHFPPDFLKLLLSVSYSTARGIIYSVTKGSYLNQFFLPIINPDELYNTYSKKIEKTNKIKSEEGSS